MSNADTLITFLTLPMLCYMAVSVDKCGQTGLHASTVDPTAIGNNDLVLGTVERTFWRSGLRKAKHLDEMLQHLADFKQYLHVEYRSAVWYPADEG